MSFILFADLFKGSGFRGEDARPAVNATQDPNYAWRVKGSICSIKTCRFCRVPAGVFLDLQACRFPLGFSVKAKKYNQTPTARSIS